MSNLLEAIVNIINHNNFDIIKSYKSLNRINNNGEALENYIKDAFSNCIAEKNENVRMIKHDSTLSWGGQQNHPPDMMLIGGDAIEVKKIESPNSDIALNSSYPKNKLKSSDPYITDGCKKCETWDEKDIIYNVGYIKNSQVKYLWFVYGSIYCADNKYYTSIKDIITKGIKGISNVNLSNTKELAKIKKIDPLGITGLRVRGMWTLENPTKVFNYIIEKDITKFQLVAIIPDEKYNSYDINSVRKIEDLSKRNSQLTIKDVNVKNPNNTVKIINCKLIEYKF